MDTPSQLIFARTINAETLLSAENCVSKLRQFKPTFKAPVQISIDDTHFVIRYGGHDQLQLWAMGTLNPLDHQTTYIQAKIGIARKKSTLRLLFGLAGLIFMMILAEGLDQGQAWGDMIPIVILFFSGISVLLAGGMAYSQHRFRHDLMHILEVK